MRERVVWGEIVFAPVAPDLSQAKIYIRLQDTSMAGDLATTVAELVLTDPAERLRDDGSIPFELEAPQLDLRRRYSISVQVNLHGGDGTSIKAGDYINMQSYPVLTYGHLEQVRMHVQRV